VDGDGAITCRIAARRLTQSRWRSCGHQAAAVATPTVTAHVVPTSRRRGAVRGTGHHMPDRSQATTHVGRDHHHHRPLPVSRRPASWHQRRGLRPRSPHVRNWATWAGTGQPRRPVPASQRRGRSATGHNARERDTGERRDAGAGTGWSRSLWPITCRIAAKRLRRDAGANDATSARERDTGERRAAWAAIGPSPAGSRPSGSRVGSDPWSRAPVLTSRRRGVACEMGHHLPDRGQAAMHVCRDRAQHRPRAHVATPRPPRERQRPSPAGSRLGGSPVPASRRRGVWEPEAADSGAITAGSRPGGCRSQAARCPVPTSRRRSSQRGSDPRAIPCRIAAKLAPRRQRSQPTTSPRARVATPGRSVAWVATAITCPIAARRRPL
jgi:hypothetical protein